MSNRTEYKRQWRKANPDKVKASLRRQRERKNAYSRAYDAAHPEQARARRRKWEVANPDKRKAIEERRRSKKYAYNCKWEATNRERRNAYKREWYRGWRISKLLETIKANMLRRRERRLARKESLKRIISALKSQQRKAGQRP